MAYANSAVQKKKPRPVGRPRLHPLEAKLDSVAEGALLKKTQRELAELRRDALLGKLVPIAETADKWEGILRTVRGMILALPARIHADMPHLTFEDVETIRRVVRQVLTETSQIAPEEITQAKRETVKAGAAYNFDRMKRERPDLAERVASGELSVSAAAVEAGYRKPPKNAFAV